MNEDKPECVWKWNDKIIQMHEHCDCYYGYDDMIDGRLGICCNCRKMVTRNFNTEEN